MEAQYISSMYTTDIEDSLECNKWMTERVLRVLAAIWLMRSFSFLFFRVALNAAPFMRIKLKENRYV